MVNKRIILDLSEKQKKIVLDLKKKCNVKSYPALVMIALGLLKTILHYKKEGYELEFTKGEKREKVIIALPIF